MTDAPTEALITQASVLIEQRIGINIRAQFGDELPTILQTIAQGDLRTLVAELERAPENAPPWQALMRALTIGETYFFRDEAYFQRLRGHILPDLIGQRRQQGRLELRIWSAGCATGEEPYSIAIALYESLSDLSRWNIQITATDINIQALQQAQQGIYRDWAFRHTAPDFQRQYFDAVSGGWQIKPFIRAMVTFEHVNLLNNRPQARFDLVFCRNVLIYLTSPQAERLEEALHNALHPGGWLVLGQSEALRYARSRWMRMAVGGLAFYQKLQAAKSPAAAAAQAAAVPGHNPSLIDDYQAAVNALHNNQLEAAERLLHTVLERQRDYAAAHTLLAFVLANRRALSDAHQHLDVALGVNPLLADAHYLRAILFLEEEQDGLARQALRSALYCQRNHALAAFMLGTFYARDGDTARAVREWENAQQVAVALPSSARVSDLSDMTAASFAQLVTSQLESLKYA